MNIYIIHENFDGRIYEIYSKKSTAERTLKSIDEYGDSYYIKEYEVEES